MHDWWKYDDRFQIWDKSIVKLQREGYKWGDMLETIVTILDLC